MKTSTLAQLWFEDADGRRILWDGTAPQRPPEAVYQVSRFARIVRQSHLRLGDGTSKEVFAGCSGWSGEQVLAMVRPTLVERLRQLMRTGRLAWSWDLDDAITVAAAGCEKCMNIAAWEHGCTWGYGRRSEAAKRSGTSCEFCR